jgi:CBS domain-containing protein
MHLKPSPGAPKKQGREIMTLRSCMTTNPLTVQPETRLKDALELMTAHGVRQLPVIDGGSRFVGIVRDFDVREALAESGDGNAERDLLSVTELGTPTLHGNASTESAWGLLSRSPGLNPLPVVTDGKLEGTVSLHDLLRSLAGLPPQAVTGRTEIRTNLHEWSSLSSPSVPWTLSFAGYKGKSAGATVGAAPGRYPG